MSAPATHPGTHLASGGPAAGAALPAIALRELAVRYGERVAVRPLTLTVPPRCLQALVGPAGSGKTSLLRSLDLLSVTVDGATLAGEAHVAGVEVTRLARERRPDPEALARLRRRVGIVFAVPSALPGSVFENVAFGARRAGVRGAALAERVERALGDAQLWPEVRDRLRLPAARLSGGQQQRLCLARTLALEPQVLLLDEPCSGLDPVSTRLIEETLRALAARLTCVLVTNNLAQARRVSDRAAFLFMGTLVEEGATPELFAAPRDPRTRDYITGRFG